MEQRKVFFAAFFVTLSIMAAALGRLYLSLRLKPSPAGQRRQGVPMAKISPDDSKSLMVEIDGEDFAFYFIFKFNALQNKIGILGISPSYELESAGGSLTQSRQKGGILQCILDIQQEFGVNIDYYLTLSCEDLSRLIGDFKDFGLDRLGENLPRPVKSLLLKGAQRLDGKSLVNALELAGGFLDNEIGLAFLNEAARRLIENNLENLSRLTGDKIKENYSNLSTNLNVQAIEKLERIVGFLSGGADIHRQVIVKGDKAAKEKAEDIFG